MSRMLEPIHPGEILLEEFLKPLGISINQLARDMAVSPGRASEIVNGKRRISADTALRLGRLLGVSPELWLGLQTDYDLRCAQRQRGTEILRSVRPYKPSRSDQAHERPAMGRGFRAHREVADAG